MSRIHNQSGFPEPWSVERCAGRGPHQGRWKILAADGALITILSKDQQGLAERIVAAVSEIHELDLDLSAIWEVHGTPGVSLAEGLAVLGRPSLLERDPGQKP